MTRRSFRRILRVLSITIASGAGYFFAVLTEQHLFLLAVVPAVFLFLVSLFEFALNDIIAAKTFPETTLSKMDVLRHPRADDTLREIARILTHLVRHPALVDVPVLTTAHLKIDIFSALEEGDALGLLQLVDYEWSPAVPTHEQRAGRFRTTSQYQGLIGRCLRTEQEDWVNFTEEADYFEKMVRDFGFSKTEAARHSKSARSYYACPIKHRDGAVIAILYMYSTQTNLFPNVVSDQAALREELSTSCHQIASLLTALGLGSV